MNVLTSLKAPAYLKSGDSVAIVAMASKVELTAISKAIKIFEEWGLDVIIGDSVGMEDHTFSGSDELRRFDFQRFINDKNVKAIFSARGGYGSSRIIDQISFDAFIENPKWIIGFSDITAVHGKIQNIGFQSIHGPMPKTMGWDEGSDNALKNALFGEMVDYEIVSQKDNRLGEGSGQLIGGNLAILAHSIGSESDLNYDGKILFIEDIGEYLYNIDRMMVQLKRAKKLTNLSGLIVGQFSSLKENDEPFGRTVTEIILKHTSHTNYPVAFNFPIGHTDENWAVRCGEAMNLSVTDTKVSLVASKFA